MVYQVLAAVVALVALLTLFVAFKALSGRDWITGFLRGSVGLLALAATLVLAFSVQDIFTFRTAEQERTLVTLSFREQEPHMFQVDMQEMNGDLRTVNLQGEQWQLNVRMLKWTPLFTAMGFRSGYRFDSIQGRYLVMEMDKLVTQVPEALSVSEYVDVWRFLSDKSERFSSVQALMVSPGFIPMADGAMFEVALSGSNLTAKPLNDAAKAAMAHW